MMRAKHTHQSTKSTSWADAVHFHGRQLTLPGAQEAASNTLPGHLARRRFPDESHFNIPLSACEKTSSVRSSCRGVTEMKRFRNAARSVPSAGTSSIAARSKPIQK